MHAQAPPGVVLGALGYFAYDQYRERRPRAAIDEPTSKRPDVAAKPLSLRRPRLLLADDFLRGSDLFPAQLPRREDGRRRRRRAVRTAVVRQPLSMRAGATMARHEIRHPRRCTCSVCLPRRAQPLRMKTSAAASGSSRATCRSKSSRRSAASPRHRKAPREDVMVAQSRYRSHDEERRNHHRNLDLRPRHERGGRWWSPSSTAASRASSARSSA